MSEQGELFRARTHIRSSRANFFAQTPTTRPRRANFFAHRTQPRGDDATNDTSTATDAGQHETTITSATEKRTQNAHFSPAKAMAVSVGLSLREQRRRRFQTTGPPGRQGLAAVPVGGGRAWPGDQCAISVTNVVKPEQFEPPCECSCYKRRQSASKNLDFQRKSPRIDDVCNNGSEIHTKNTSD